MAWEQPPENSLDALLHGMRFSDGVEFDLRLSADEELVVYHDSITADVATQSAWRPQQCRITSALSMTC